MIDWSISVGNIVTVAGFLATAGGIMFKIGQQMQKIKDLAGEVGGFREDMKKLGDILSNIAVQNNRLDMHDKLIDELRRGDGYILNRGHGKI